VDHDDDNNIPTMDPDPHNVSALGRSKLWSSFLLFVDQSFGALHVASYQMLSFTSRFLTVGTMALSAKEH